MGSFIGLLEGQETPRWVRLRDPGLRAVTSPVSFSLLVSASHFLVSARA